MIRGLQKGMTCKGKVLGGRTIEDARMFAKALLVIPK